MGKGARNKAKRKIEDSAKRKIAETVATNDNLNEFWKLLVDKHGREKAQDIWDKAMKVSTDLAIQEATEEVNNKK